jgi:hypothetical protein
LPVQCRRRPDGLIAGNLQRIVCGNRVVVHKLRIDRSCQFLTNRVRPDGPSRQHRNS